MFTDIEGSTKLVHELGSHYPEVLNLHHRLLRAAFARHAGVEVVTTGDGFFVAFSEAKAALDAALDAQRALAHVDAAEQLFRRGVEELTARGETGFNSTMTALLAHALCDGGSFDEAEEYVSKSRRLAAKDDFATQSSWRLALARILSDRGEHSPAITLAEEAAAIVDATDYIAWQGDAHEVRGNVLLAAGRRDEARAALAEALARYERKGVVPLAARLRARLDDL